MRILLGVDNSPQAQAAIDLIERLAWDPETEVTVISVAGIPAQTYSEVYAGVGAVPVEAWEADQRLCEQISESAAAELKAAGLKAKTCVVKGDPREALVDLARAEHADLLVVGSHGRTGLSKFLMGSVASHVVTHAPCSVLVVKQNPSR